LNDTYTHLVDVTKSNSATIITLVHERFNFIYGERMVSRTFWIYGVDAERRSSVDKFICDVSKDHEAATLELCRIMDLRGASHMPVAICMAPDGKLTPFEFCSREKLLDPKLFACKKTKLLQS
ncbi:TPA: hypothetical protein N0F65_010594, partial [Lagenidium giganteum]